MMDIGARMKCASARCGLVSPGALAEDAAQRALSSRKLGKAVVFCLIFMVVETVGGVLANSLAILADAAHLLSDIAGFVISLCAICASGWEATPSQSFGFYRLEILGGLLSIQLIWLLTGILVYEAIRRLFDPSQLVDGRLMFGIASVGLLVNLAMIFMLGHDCGVGQLGHRENHSHQHSAASSSDHITPHMITHDDYKEKNPHKKHHNDKGDGTRCMQNSTYILPDLQEEIHLTKDYRDPDQQHVSTCLCCMSG
jgi:zinc transporter 2